jgi:hypothetical protein
MSEMLGNQYFLARRYAESCRELESELDKSSSPNRIAKKLIICYLQTDQLQKAFDTFYKLVTDDIEIITDTNPEKDDCPCPEIIDDNLPLLEFKNEFELNLKMGILWLYCEPSKSLQFFEKIKKGNKDSERIKEIITQIRTHLVKIKQELQ